MPRAPRLMIIGLDCAEPSLAFEAWRADLPNLDTLMRRGRYGRLESCIPAITVPAWSCMMSGRDPGELGVYGFNNRPDRSYQRMRVADARAIRQPRLWDMLGAAGWRTVVVGVPGTYPAPEVNGALVSCFLAPNIQAEYTYPPEVANRVADWAGDYLLDVPNFRSEDKARILADIYRMCDQRFTVATRLLEQEEPDMLMMVEMGVDRIHHALWKQMDPRHPGHQPGMPFADAIHTYYKHVDARIGELLAYADDNTTILVVSDHGGRPLMGGVCVNQWLIDNGYLTLKETPATPRPLDPSMAAWDKTTAWSAGGYYGRIFLNVQGREPEGVIPLADYERARAELADHLRAMLGPDGRPLGNRVFTPQEIYRAVRGVAPDLLIYFGDLAYRALGTVGGADLFSAENDTGPDDANHAQYGLFVYVDPERPANGEVIEGASIYDVAPTLLTRFGVSAPVGLRGRAGALWASPAGR